VKKLASCSIDERILANQVVVDSGNAGDGFGGNPDAWPLLVGLDTPQSSTLNSVGEFENEQERPGREGEHDGAGNRDSRARSPKKPHPDNEGVKMTMFEKLLSYVTRARVPSSQLR
jgi:hypothetical protein